MTSEAETWQLEGTSGMLDVARAGAPELEWAEGSASALPFGIVVCQPGLQFLSLADSQELRDLCTAAGFAAVRIETVACTIRFASVEEWVGIQLAATPLASLPSKRDDLVARVGGDVAGSLTAYIHDDGFAFPQEVHVAIATV